MKNSDEFYEHNDKIRAGNINDILLLDEYTVIVYRKGLSREEQIEIEDSFSDVNFETEKRDPFYAVVLDKNYDVISSDVLFPYGVYYPNMVNNSNEIVALKNPEMFGVEEEFLTLYQIVLKFD